MEKLTKERHQEILDFYLTLNTHEFAHLINMGAERITVPVGLEDGVDIQTASYTSLNGPFIDIITREFDERVDEERQKRVDNLLKDSNNGKN